MAKISRRNLLKVAGTGSIAAGLGVVTKAEKRVAKGAGSKSHNHKPISGPLANATVSFGQWQTGPTPDGFPGTPDTEFDRTDPLLMGPPPMGGPNNIFRNHHQLIPYEATIKAGGSVNFIVAGFHQIVIYSNGKKPEDVSLANLLPIGPGLINDDVNRVFRGLAPATVPQDRVEVVHFANTGLYLVICAVLPHFQNDKMYGWVRVLP